MYDLAPPAGHADADAFNRALADELDKLHTTKVEPLDQTLRGVHQSDSANHLWNMRHVLSAVSFGRDMFDNPVELGLI